MKTCEYCKCDGVSCIDHVDAEHCPNYQLKQRLKKRAKVTRKLSNSLYLKTKLTPDQLERLRGESGKGLSSKYNEQGEQTLELTRRLLKARNKCPKFVLYSTSLGRELYVADRALVKIKDYETPLTFNKSEALVFYLGFDEPEVKIKFYNKLFNQQFQTKNI